MRRIGLHGTRWRRVGSATTISCGGPPTTSASGWPTTSTLDRATRLGLENVDNRVLDAEQMDLDDDSVDGIICRWGFMLMLRPEMALSECRRVLKDGRRIALSVWAGPERNPWVTVTGMTMVQLGYQPGGDPFDPG